LDGARPEPAADAEPEPAADAKPETTSEADEGTGADKDKKTSADEEAREAVRSGVAFERGEDVGLPVLNSDTLDLTDDAMELFDIDAAEADALGQVLDSTWEKLKAAQAESIRAVSDTNIIRALEGRGIKRLPDVRLVVGAFPDEGRSARTNMYAEIEKIIGPEQAAALAHGSGHQLNSRFRYFGGASRDISIWVEGEEGEKEYWIFERCGNSAHSHFGEYTGIESLPEEYRHLFEEVEAD
jgi:hypothetical protein